ncbi:MAG: hydrogenase small subunit [Chloroflexota bacterium]
MTVKELPVVWLQTACCTGCSVSLLNSASPTIKNILIDQIIPGVHINLRFHATIMAGSGEPVLQVLEDTAKNKSGEYVLCVEGAIPTATDASYGVLGERGGKPVGMRERVEELARQALAVLAVGTCASFGGIPAAAPNPTGCKPVRQILAEKGINKPLINLPGCPPHPDWFVGTVASILLKGLPQASKLDDNLRPLAFYGKLIHENCPRRAYFDEGKFAKKPGEEGCLYELGCKGPITYADCPLRRWNGGTNWVIGAGAPCNGCTQPEFPDGTSPFYQKLAEITAPTVGAYWQASKETK